MVQKLIVEGNDSIALAKLLKKRGVPNTKGYSDGFFINSKGVNNLQLAVEVEINKTENTNIGIVLDANEKGVQSRLDMISNLVGKHHPSAKLELLRTPSPIGQVAQVLPTLKIGIWVMPDNQKNGYLEHFLSELIPENDALYGHSKKILDDLEREGFCRFTPLKKQKALLHTYLAWQEQPGKPFGTAIEANYLTSTSTLADRFEAWIRNVFELEK